MMLNTKKIQEFKNILVSIRKQLTRSIEKTSSSVKTPTEEGAYSQHQADEASDDMETAISLGLSQEESHILKQVDRALEKIEENSYGICDLTQQAIPLKRLEAIPYATTTVQAQEMLEQESGKP